MGLPELLTGQKTRLRNNRIRGTHKGQKVGYTAGTVTVQKQSCCSLFTGSAFVAKIITSSSVYNIRRLTQDAKCQKQVTSLSWGLLPLALQHRMYWEYSSKRFRVQTGRGDWIARQPSRTYTYYLIIIAIIYYHCFQIKLFQAQGIHRKQ